MIRRALGGIISPTTEELKAIGKQYHFEISDEELDYFSAVIEGFMPAYRKIEALPDPKPPVKYPRTPGYQPSADENPLNAWYWRTSIKGEPSGKLAGKTVAVKDTIALAGVPMMIGSAVMEGFMPDYDATVVTRILDAGGEIVGKATCEDFCCSGSSQTSVPGPVRNPHNPAYSAGGSSSGSGAVVVAGDCDMALGGDQGGSIRIPAAQVGAVGLKPTWSLVPFTGIASVDATIDHVGPMTRTVEDTALLLEAVAGYDPDDARQSPGIKGEEYTKACTGEAKGLRIGILEEGFGWGDDSKDTDAAVREAVHAFERAGATVGQASVPMHRDGVDLWTALLIDGFFVQLILLNGANYGGRGFYDTRAIDYMGRSRKTMADNFPAGVKLLTLHGHYMLEHYNGRYYAKSQNQRKLLTRSYDEAFKDFDILALPTLAPWGMAHELSGDPTPSLEQLIENSFSYHVNTCPTDLTGNPGISIPCAKINSLPVGMMLLGRRWEDGTVIRAAHAFQELGLYHHSP